MRQNAQHATRRPFPWFYFGTGVALGALVGSFLGAMAWDILT